MHIYKKHIFFIIPLLFIIIFSLLIVSCHKDKVDSNSTVELQFSATKILFDTVFRTVGSTTQFLTVYNPYNQIIKISNIRLAGGNNSMFSININGTYTTSASNLEIQPKDSMFIFVKVTVNPNNSNNPFVVSDSIQFITNGNTQYVDSVAWGQDAHFVVANTFQTGLPPYIIVAQTNQYIHWYNDKPWVIYGYAVVDSLGTLNIAAGTRVYFYNNSGLWVYRYGNIHVDGVFGNPVTFQGSRLDTSYKNIPGQWDRIWINEGPGNKTNTINYAIIKNSFIGIQAECLSAEPLHSPIAESSNSLLLTNTIIENCTGYGILARAYQINAANCVVANCGQYAIALTLGGAYNFRNCTVGNYWNYSSRQTPSIVLNNYQANSNGGDSINHNLNYAFFGNCILWGNNDEELLLDKQKGTFNYAFDYCVLKTQINVTKNSHFFNDSINKDPLFSNYNYNNYRLTYGSPAIKAGSDIILTKLTPLTNFLKTDISGNPRTSPPDEGAYVYIKKNSVDSDSGNEMLIFSYKLLHCFSNISGRINDMNSAFGKYFLLSLSCIILTSNYWPGMSHCPPLRSSGTGNEANNRFC